MLLVWTSHDILLSALRRLRFRASRGPEEERLHLGTNVGRRDNATLGFDGDVAHTGGIARGPSLAAVGRAGGQFAAGAVAKVGLQFRACG